MTAGQYRRANFYETLRKLRLLDNMQLCLDAGDRLSFEGGADTWRDLTGNGNHFYLGSGTGSDSADPTHNGVAGRRTGGEYFVHDGGDRFTLAQSAPAWQSAMHKTGAVFTILQWVYVATLSGLSPSQAGFGCGDSVSSVDGRYLSFGNSGSTQNALSLGIADETGSAAFGNKSTILVTNAAWQMVAVSVDIAAAAIVFAVNDTTEVRSPAVNTALSASDSAVPLVIGALAADGTAAVISGCRIAASAIWARALTTTELVKIFNATRARYGV